MQPPFASGPSLLLPALTGRHVFSTLWKARRDLAYPSVRTINASGEASVSQGMSGIGPWTVVVVRNLNYPYRLHADTGADRSGKAILRTCRTGGELCRSQTTPSIFVDESGKPYLLKDNESSEVLEKIMAGDLEKITEIYHQLLEGLSQVNLKKVLKVWIKLIAPHKQCIHPYCGGKTKEEAIWRYGSKKKGELTKPSWWPRDIIHCEPDHILKSDRIRLAQHLLRLHGFSSDIFRKSTIDIAQNLEEKFSGSVPQLLDELYGLRRMEEQVAKRKYIFRFVVAEDLAFFLALARANSFIATSHVEMLGDLWTIGYLLVQKFASR
ncbi:hypothetical protein MMC22_001544 [Lobaria immixta]|nr:hypothetical protein [Lobaria immixta]